MVPSRRRIGEHIVGLQIFVQVAPEAVGVPRAEVVINPAYREVHPGELSCGRVRLLTVDADVADAPVQHVLVLR
jgi:hypothetical protein